MEQKKPDSVASCVKVRDSISIDQDIVKKVIIDSSKCTNDRNATVPVCKKNSINKGNFKLGVVKFAYFNARSIVNKLNELKLFLIEENVDIVGISETWLTSNILDSELQVSGFTLFRRDRQNETKRKGGGVALYVKCDLNPTVLEIDSDSFQESLWCKINLNEQSTTIGVIYRAPDSSDQNDDYLYKLVDFVSSGRVIFMGDFNFPSLDWGSSERIDVSHPFVEAMGRNFLYQHVEQPTRGDNYLDLVISSNNTVEELTVEEPFETSDHQIIKFEIIIPRKQKTKKQKKHNYFKADYNQIREHACKIDWQSIFKNNGSVNSAWSMIKSNLLKLRDSYVKFKSQSKNKCKWVTREARKCRIAKKKAWNDYVKSGKNSKQYEVYKTKLNLSKAANTKAKYNYEKKLADNIKKDTKSFYAYVNNKNSNSGKIGPIKDSQGNLIENDESVADLLNNYFSTVFVAEDISNLPVLNKLGNLNGYKLCELKIDKIAVYDKLSKLNVNKSQGPDQIHGKLLYELRYEICETLVTLFQLSVQTGDIPQDFRDADVVPLHKKGSKSKCENYRPISLTSIVGKLLESIIKDNILNHLDKYKLIKNSQHGFTSGRSCLTNLLDFFETVTYELDGGNNVDLIYLDFSKAFDKVPHKRLISKLTAHGVEGVVGKWVENWLAGRRQRVVINGEYSKWCEVKSGVPQGSILGPFLFLIYINDLDDNIISKINKFADDCKLGKAISSDADAEILRQDLLKLSDWAEKWQMDFNIDKCSVVHLGRNNSENSYEIKGNKLNSSKLERDLGVLIDKNMKFSEQCNKTVNNANATLGFIKRSIVCKNKDIILRLYKALVRPKLDYCVQAWRPYLKKDIEKLEKVQHRATKLIDECKNLSYTKRLKYTGLTTLEQRRDRGDYLEVYKFIKGVNKLDYKKFFSIAIGSRTRGHKYKLDKNRSRLDLRKYFFSQRIVNGWNALPEEIVDALSVNTFKIKYDKYMRDRSS